MKNTVYIITHKDYNFPKIDDYKVLVVGANKNSFSNDYLKDNTEENISDKNNSYSELTGLYWIWKNDNSDHVGLVHYRRYFVDIKRNLNFKGRHVFISKKNKYRILSVNELEDMLKGKDILVKQSRYSKLTNEQLLRRNLGIELYDNMTEVINNGEDKYIDYYREVSNEHYHLNCNMFYGDKKIVDKYCEWLFDVLNKIDENHKVKSGEYYRNRELGYLSEILFEVWLKTNSIKYDIVPAINIDNYMEVDGCMNLFEFIKYLLNRTYLVIKENI